MPEVKIKHRTWSTSKDLPQIKGWEKKYKVDKFLVPFRYMQARKSMMRFFLHRGPYSFAYPLLLAP